MKVLIPGGSGQVGTILARAFVAGGHEVTILSRGPALGPWRVLPWDARTLGSWQGAVDAADVVINLAGRNVNCRYTAANRADILNSRVESTRVIGEAIAQSPTPPRLWLQASTATIYRHTFDSPNDESGVIGGSEPDVPRSWDFSITVARAWEQALSDANTPRTRKVAMRSAMVMSPDKGGIFDTLATLARLGLGGRAGSGRQYVSWIHERDFIRAVQWLIDRSEVSGWVNIAAPNPLPYADFMRGLRQALGSRIGLPATEWMLSLGALFMGTETELVLKSRRVVPGRLLQEGFIFEFPTWAPAAADLVRQPG